LSARSEPRAGVHDFSTDLDGRIIVAVLEGTQRQPLTGRIEQEQRNVVK